MTASLWHASGPLAGRRTQIVVIGAGITGLAAAIAFERAGSPALILERHAPAAGGSGRNAGYLMRGVAANYALAADRLGRDTARELWAFNEANIADLRAEGIERMPATRARPSCLVALERGEEEEIERSAVMLTEDGFDAELIRPGSSRASDSLWASGAPRLGLLNPHDAVCNPVELVGMLASKLERTELVRGCTVATIEPDAPAGALAVRLNFGHHHRRPRADRDQRLRRLAVRTPGPPRHAQPRADARRPGPGGPPGFLVLPQPRLRVCPAIG